MTNIERFFSAIKKEEMVTLATSGSEGVTMRIVSPVYVEGKILIFTNADSLKYRQLKENPRCCMQAGGMFAQATAEFLGPTMAPENEAYRKAYEGKFPGAFDEGMEFGGRADDFVLFTPTFLTGWGFKDDVPTPDGIPNMPFAIKL